MVRGIKFVGIPVHDQDVALNFYTKALGLKVATDQPFNDKQRWIELLIPRDGRPYASGQQDKWDRDRGPARAETLRKISLAESRGDQFRCPSCGYKPYSRRILTRLTRTRGAMPRIPTQGV
jgi:catechol 2,3-dioxygenase-like lactoylglutathione lyase family enzyme